MAIRPVSLKNCCEIYGDMNGYNWDALFMYYLAQLAEIIVSLVENEEELYRLVREEGDKIQWD